MEIEPIAHIRTDFPDKFGVPRQSGLVPELMGQIVFEPKYRNADALRGLEDFSHLWLLWDFSLCHRPEALPSENFPGNGAETHSDNRASGSSASGSSAFESSASGSSVSESSASESSASGSNAETRSGNDADWQPTVRPPRLGGNRQMGVFATRSPFRPNHIGLSCVRLERIDLSTSEGPVLTVSGADLMDGTPIYDIKPYVRFTDSHPQAVSGFVDQVDKPTLEVVFPQELLQQLPAGKRQAALGVLRQDPRPAYQHSAEKTYGLSFAGYNIRFRVDGQTAVVINVTPIQ